jgi:hypothetical protein
MTSPFEMLCDDPAVNANVRVEAVFTVVGTGVITTDWKADAVQVWH